MELFKNFGCKNYVLLEISPFLNVLNARNIFVNGYLQKTFSKTNYFHSKSNKNPANSIITNLGGVDWCYVSDL